MEAVSLRIGVVAGTHVPTRARSLPAQLLYGLQGADLILRAGDLVSGERLAALAPVESVCGNNDAPELSAALGRQTIVWAYGYRIGSRMVCSRWMPVEFEGT